MLRRVHKVVVHLEPILLTGRVFIKGGRWGDPYDAVFTVQRVGNVGYVSACHGKINKQAVLDLQEQLEALGMTEMKWRRGRDI